MALGKNLSWCFSLVIWRSRVIGFSLHAYCCGSVAQMCPTLCDAMDCGMLGFPVLHCLPELAQLMSTESRMPTNRVILCPSLLLLPSILPSISVFSRVGSSHQVAELLELQLHHQSLQWILGLHSFRTDWFDLLTVQGTLKIFTVGWGILTCSMWVLVPWPGTKPRPLTLRVLATGPPGKAPSCGLDGLPSVPVCVLISSWKNTSYIGWRFTLMNSF